MDNHKIHHPVNFAFASCFQDGAFCLGEERLAVTVQRYAEGVSRLEVGGRWSVNASQTELSPPPILEETAGGWQIDGQGLLRVADEKGNVVLEGCPKGSLGVSGASWMVEFAYDPDYRFYGMGEKMGSFEKTGVRTKFWNRDVFADFDKGSIAQGKTDPMYVSIPWLIVRTPTSWVGVLINTPEAPFISAGGTIGAIANQQKLSTDTRFYLGADAGKPDLWAITAPDLATLTQRYQRLVGTTPRPPLWALGHHQCRWGYADAQDLREVREQMARHGIPNSGLWLDIDYMESYKVFTWNPELWSDVAAEVAELQADGQRVVPILDPGVKVESGYPVYESGLAEGSFCPTPEGLPFTGYVWPGATHFPDYSTDSGRAWWAEKVKTFSETGFTGYWLDMNDPSVGPVELYNLCFGPKAQPHATFHNQYATGMARATREGMLAAHPDQRPFLLARSGWVGCQKYTALWTGDNLSNQAYLEGSAACSLNLALSGVPLNGPDVPGFGEDASEELAVHWYRLGFLFPFLRNHSMKGTRAQEPYAFWRETREEIARLIRFRYRLLPYLYQLWQAQEATGEAVMRPLLYDFDQTSRFALERVEDQFLIGPSLMQAPFGLKQAQREVLFPVDDWYDLSRGEWIAAESVEMISKKELPTPLYVRSGSVIPLCAEEIRHSTEVDLARVDLHVFLQPGQSLEYRYTADDGESFGYGEGEESSFSLRLEMNEERMLAVKVLDRKESWKSLKVRLVLHGKVRGLTLKGHGDLALKPFALPTPSGSFVEARVSGEINELRSKTA